MEILIPRKYTGKIQGQNEFKCSSGPRKLLVINDLHAR